jgi:predicted outer membrane protein
LFQNAGQKKAGKKDPMRTVPLACSLLAALWAAPATGAPQGIFATSAAVAAPGPRSSTPAQRLERRFLQLAAAHLRFQAQASRLALARSAHPGVRDLAAALVARQEAVEPELLRLLHARGMALPFTPDAHARVLRRLAKLEGAKFDRLYVEEVLASSRTDGANHRKVAAEAEDPVIRAWAERQLPALKAQEATAGRALPPAALRAQRTS